MSSKFRRSAAVIFALLLIAAGLAIEYAHSDKNGQSFQFFAMDSACTVTLYGDEENLQKIRSRISELDKALSAYNEKSEVFRINSGETVCDEITESIVKRSVLLNKKYPETDCTSGRLIDLWNVTGESPKVPSDDEIDSALRTIGSENIIIGNNGISVTGGTKLNFGCCAKGFALDELKAVLDESKTDCAVISFGSSSLLYGSKPDGEEFETSIRNPDDPNKTVLKVSTGECFMSTSGGYERFFEADGKRYSHIFDLKTGYPAATDLTSVTVISKTDGMLTDFLSTAIYIGGTEKIKEYLADESVMIIALDEKKNIYCSESIKNKIEITSPDFHFA